MGRRCDSLAVADHATPPYRGLPYVAGLDGVRAIAVAGCCCTTAASATFSGGFLGVDVFFVLSGFLITSLLLSERARRGRIDLAAFWLRRARRLLPAAFLVVGVCTLVVAVFYPSLLPRARGDAIASFFYVNNWHQVFAHESYFAALGRPPLLQHLWSLAVEEQFYLVWPIVLALCLNRLGRWPTALVTIIGAAASALAMGLLFRLGQRPVARLLRHRHARFGAAGRRAAGVAWPRSAGVARRRRAAADVFLDFLGGGGADCDLRGDDELARLRPRCVSRWAAAVRGARWRCCCSVVTDPAAHIGAVLGVAPLRWIGQRSYGIYLWHWPVMVLTRPGIDLQWNRWVLVPAQIGVAVLLAAASYRWVEMPVRRGDAWPAIEALARPLRAAPAAGDRDGDDRRVPRHGGLGRGAPDAARRGAAQERADRGGDRRPALQRDGQAAGRRGVGDARRLSRHSSRGSSSTRRSAASRATSWRGFESYRDAHHLPGRVIVQMGENGPVFAPDIRGLRQALAGVPRVLIVNVRVPRSWQGEVNHILAKTVAAWPQAHLVDWHDASASPKLLYDDEIHPNPAGQKVYARVVDSALGLPPARPTRHPGSGSSP